MFHYLGPSFAVLLFVHAAGARGRLAADRVGGRVFAIWRRPWAALREPLVIAWGATLALMNCCFYEAIDRLPLGTVAAIEFVPVIGLAALGARSVRNAVALGLAIGGVALLSDVQLSGAPLGFAFAARRRGAVRAATSCSRTAHHATRGSARLAAAMRRRARVRHAARRLAGAAGAP